MSDRCVFAAAWDNPAVLPAPLQDGAALPELAVVCLKGRNQHVVLCSPRINGLMERAGARFEDVRTIFGMAARISHKSPCQLSNQGRAAHKGFARSDIEAQPRPIGPFAVPRRRAIGGRYLVAERTLVPSRHLRHPRHALCATFELQSDTTLVAGHNRHGPQTIPVSLLLEKGLEFTREPPAQRIHRSQVDKDRLHPQCCHG